MANKILQITHKPPFPKIDGGCLEIAKMSNYYDSSEEFELDIFSLSTYKHPFVEKEFKKSLTKKTNLFSVKANTRPSFFGALKAFFSGKSYNLSRFVNNVTIEKLIKLVHENKYDFIQFESIYAAQFVSFIKPLSQAKLVLNTPNVEYNLWKQNASKASFLKK
ncbi:hypothetical protein N9P38_01850, partial [Flavobacteriales bacterium]|nr:hypothetical protein [Flavobacteriales bacterium]